MRRLKRLFIAPILAASLVLSPAPAKADMFGGDVAVLVQILAQAIQQLAQLRAILGTGQDTLGLLEDINRGLRDGLSIIQIINPNFNPGILGNIDDVNKLLSVLTQLYGRVPHTADAQMQNTHDQTVAESLSMNSRLFSYADQVDRERDRILSHSQVVSPQGSAKLQNQAIAVLIGVSTQLLRTNSSMLKIMAENLALQNKKEKLSSEQFRAQYDGISKALSTLPEDPKLSFPGGN